MTRRAALTAALLVALGGVGVVVGFSRSSTDGRPSPHQAAATPAPSLRRHRATRAGSKHVAVVAAARHRSVAVYRARGGPAFLRLRNPNADGARLVFLVRRRGRQWARVYLPVRPNGSMGWIRRHDVTLLYNPFRVEISLGRRRLTVRRRDRTIMRVRIGVGRSVTPTPRGTYFITELLRQPNPDGIYGPYAFGLSAFSDVLYTFGGGPGQIGLHGTNNPAALGSLVSHGCIRVSNRAIRRLAQRLPLGTPVRIVS